MMLYNLAKALNPVFGRYWELDLTGEGKKFIPEEGPMIIAMNHVSYLDPWFLANVFPRDLHFLVTNAWYDRSPTWRWFFRSFGTYPVKNDAKETILSLKSVLDEGNIIGIFPEGLISPTGSLQRFKPGLAVLASLSGVPVMPVGIQGSRESLPITSRWPKRGRIEMRLGRPFKFPGSPWTHKTPPRRVTVEFLNRTKEKICQLSDQDNPDA